MVGIVLLTERLDSSRFPILKSPFPTRSSHGSLNNTSNVEAVGVDLDTTSRVQTFERSAVSAPYLVEALKRDGGVLIRNFVDCDSIAAIEQDVRPFINEDTACEGNFFPMATRRLMGLA